MHARWTSIEHAIEHRAGKYRVRLRGKYVGTYFSLENARRQRDALIQVMQESPANVAPSGGLTLDQLWTEHLAWRTAEAFRNIVTDACRWSCHVSPLLGHLPARAVSAAQVMDALEDVARSFRRHWCSVAKQHVQATTGTAVTRNGKPCCRSCGKPQKRLAFRTVKCVKNLISATYQFGIWKRLIDRSPMGEVVIRAPRQLTPIRYFTLAQIEHLLSVVPEPQRFMVDFSKETGLRLGELMAMELAAVHLDDVAEPYIDILYGGPAHAPTKTGVTRRIYLTARGERSLRAWLASLPAWSPKNPHGLAFPTRRGAYHRTPPRGWRAWLVGSGLATRGFCWHSLRHTCATLSLNGELDGHQWELSAVQSMLGHADQRTTQNYAILLNLPQLAAVRRGAARDRLPKPPDAPLGAAPAPPPAE